MIILNKLKFIISASLIPLVLVGCTDRLHEERNNTAPNNSRLVFDVTLGQSLGTNRVGPAYDGEEVWTATADYIDKDLTGLYSFDRIFAPGNKQNGIDVYLENIASQTFQPAVDQAYGASTERGNVASNSPFISSALSYRESNPNVDIHLSSLAMGGQEIDFFTKGSELTREGNQLANWWTGAFVPTLEALCLNASISTYDDVDTYFKWLQGEADHGEARTREEYRSDLKQLHFDIISTYQSTFGEIDREAPLFLSYQMGRIYAPHRQNYGDASAPYRISEVTLGTLDLGLSDRYELNNFVSIPPSYAFSFSGISHMDQAGYHALQSMFGYVASEAERVRDNGAKWKPLHVTSSARIIEDGLKIELPFHSPVDGAKLKIGVPDSREFFSVPEKPSAGISLHCDGTSPSITGVTLVSGKPVINVTLSEPWDCENRKVGIAYQTEKSYFQGWQRRGGQPDGERYHNGLGSNIYIETNWTEPFSKRKHIIYASHQLVEID